MEKTLLIIKPDGVQRGLVGEILSRFERKGLKIVGLKMMQLGAPIVREHYFHHAEKSFFPDLSEFMQSCPVVIIALEGKKAMEFARAIAGVKNTDLGTIRGDFVLSGSKNIVHSSDSVEAAEKEIQRFFREDELFEYEKDIWKHVFGNEDL